jgi:hypothetical protein
VPSELYPGIDYAFQVLDPDGHVISLYFGMEQIGWDGKPRPPELRPQVDAKTWPATIEPHADPFSGETLLGPSG